MLKAGDSKNTTLESLDISSIKSNFNLKSIVFFVLKDISSPSADRLVSSSSKETSSDMLETGDLTGVSKYFYDLDETLNAKSTNPPLEIISELATELKTEIGGEFIFENKSIGR
jgi:hypothetical protein